MFGFGCFHSNFVAAASFAVVAAATFAVVVAAAFAVVVSRLVSNFLEN